MMIFLITRVEITFGMEDGEVSGEIQRPHASRFYENTTNVYNPSFVLMQQHPKTWFNRVEDGLEHGFSSGVASIFSHYFVKVFDKGVNYFFQSEEDYLIQEHNKNAKRVNVYTEKLKMLFGLMQARQQQLELAKSPHKKEHHKEQFRRLNQSRKVISREHDAWEHDFTESILKHRDLKKRQPRTVFENKNGELMKVQESSSDNNSPQQQDKTSLSDEYDQFLESTDKDTIETQE